MIAPELRGALARLVEQEIACASQLLAVLRRERDSLDGREAAALQEVAAEKERLAAHLDELAAEHRGLLSQAGVDLGEGALPASLVGTEAGAAARWRELGNVLRDCRQQNLVNGSIIELGRRFSEQLLDAIRGTSGEDRLYGSRGEALPLRRAGPLSSA